MQIKNKSSDKKKSFRKISNNKDHSIESCGTAVMISSDELRVLLKLTLWEQFFK